MNFTMFSGLFFKSLISPARIVMLPSQLQVTFIFIGWTDCSPTSNDEDSEKLIFPVYDYCKWTTMDQSYLNLIKVKYNLELFLYYYLHLDWSYFKIFKLIILISVVSKLSRIRKQEVTRYLDSLLNFQIKILTWVGNIYKFYITHFIDQFCSIL